MLFCDSTPLCPSDRVSDLYPQCSRNSPSIARISAGLINRACATVTECNPGFTVKPPLLANVRYGVINGHRGQLKEWSALPPKADIDQHGCDVRFAPIADIAAPQSFGRFFPSGEEISFPLSCF